MTAPTKRTPSLVLRCALACLFVWAGCQCKCTEDGPGFCDDDYELYVDVDQDDCVCNITFTKIDDYAPADVTSPDKCIPVETHVMTIRVHGRDVQTIVGAFSSSQESCHVDGGTAPCH